MTVDNKLLGQFNLNGIPPLPKGVPQIEVTFDIDANGIVHVSAKDNVSGKIMCITIKSSSRLNEKQIEEMLRKAEKMKEEDLKRKEIVEIKNEGEVMCYNIEKQIKQFEKKIPKDVVTNVRKDVKEVEEVLKKYNGDIKQYDVIKQAVEKLKNSALEIGKVLYQDKQQQQHAQGNNESKNNGDPSKNDPKNKSK